MMNLGSSKVSRSTRQIINRSVESITAYSCELYIQSFKIAYRGYVYFLWVSNNTQIHSLRYESTGKTVQVKETLTITVRVSSKNGRQGPLNTYLKLMAESGEELDECEFLINSLTVKYQEMEVPMDRGLIVLRARRKPMNVSEEESVNLNYRGGLYRSRGGRLPEDRSQGVASEYESLQEELSRVKKELQDEVYLNNKLKNDREVLLATKQQLQLEIETMIMQITKEISILREHYDSRMSIREHSYEEEIEDLVNMFNSNAEQSRKVVEMILRQKIKLEEEMKPLLERVKRGEHEIQEKIERCNRLEREKENIQIYLAQAEENLNNKGKFIDLLTNQKQELKEEVGSLRGQILDLEGELQKHSDALRDRDSTINGLEDKNHELQSQLQGKAMRIHELEQSLHHGQEKEQGFHRQNGLLQREMALMQQEKKGLNDHIDSLKAKLQEFEYEMEFNENVLGQLKRQKTEKEEELYLQIDGLESVYAKKMDDIIKGYQLERDEFAKNYHDLQLEKEELEKKVAELQGHVAGSSIKLEQLGGEINNLTNQIKSNHNNGEEKDQLIALLQKQNHKLKQDNHDLRAEVDQFNERRDGSPKLNKKGSSESFRKKDGQMARLEQEIKRLNNQLNEALREIDRLREERGRLQNELKGKGDRSIKNSKENRDFSPDRQRSQKSLINKIDRPLSAEEANQIVQRKEREIGQLRRRVEELENLYHNIQNKIELIVLKYPQVDLQQLQPAKLQICDSEQEEERIINGLVSNNSTTPVNNNAGNNEKKGRRVSKRGSFAEAIAEREEDLYSNPSLKHAPEKRRYEPSSEKKIAEPVDYQKGVLRKQSLAGTVTIEVPRSPTMKREHSGSYDPSERSGASYVKVSHSKKIRDLERQIQELFEREKGYKAKIEDYLKNISQLNKQVESVRGAVHNYGSEKSMKGKASDDVKSKENKQSQVFIEDQRLKNFANQSRIKEQEIQKLVAKLTELEQALRNQRAEADKKIILLEAKTNEASKRDEDSHRKIESLAEINRQLQRDNQDLDERLRKERQAAQELRLNVKELNMHMENAQNQLKKLRHANEVLEEKVQKMSGSDLIIKELNRQIEEQSKRGLEQTRMVNHLKLEKDSIEEELRLLKKRQNDQTRIATEWEEKASSLERSIQQAKRKENKLKREIEEAQEETRRTKLQMKKVEQQLQIMASSQTGWQVERRKHIDEISNLQDQLSRKDYQYNKLNKQIEKWRLRAEEKDEIKMGRKSEMRQEIDRLQSELIRKQKKILEQTEQNKLLRSRLELLQKENKRIMQQRNQTYGQKLKQYVQEMSSIKKLLEQYQNQNSRLKVDSNQLYQQAELIRINYDKLQNKYDDSIERQENILNDLQSYIAELNTLKDRLSLTHSQLDQAETAYLNLRKEADEDKLLIRKMNDRNQTTERNLERSQLEIRDLRVRVSEYETNQEINGKMSERYKLADRRKTELEEQCRKLKAEYDNLVSVFIYKREDLEKAVGDTRMQERRLKEEELQKLNEECNKLLASKTQRLEQEVLESYQEASRLRNEIQIYQEENGRFKGRIIELENAFDRYGTLQIEYDNLRHSNDELKQELRKRQQRLTKTEISVEGLQSESNMKERQLNSLRSRILETDKTIQKLNQDILKLRSSQRELQADLNELKSKKNKEKEEEINLTKQRENHQLQQYEIKINGLELQLQRLREKEGRVAEDNTAKMKILERKMDEMEQALREKEKAIENHYEAALQELQNSLLRISQELQEKMGRIEELNEAIILLQGENKDLNREIQESRYLYDQQRQLMETELAKLKTKMKEAESAYALNIRTLQEEIAKNQGKNNISNSRLKGSDAEERVAKRYEEKLKSKDRKIEELKENMYALEETLVKLKKKDSAYQSSSVEIERIKISYAELDRERKTMETRFQEEIQRQSDVIKQLKRQILALREEEDRLKLTAEERTLEMESTRSQLKTVRELYQELQKELERRKHTLTNQLEEESSLQMQLRIQEGRVIELQEKLAEVSRQSREWETDSKRKSMELRRNIEQMQELTQTEQTHKQDNLKLTQELTITRKSLLQLTSSSQSAKNQLRQSKNELARFKKNQQDLRISYLNNEQTISQLKRTNQQLTMLYRQCEQAARKYNALNNRCCDEMGCQIEELLGRYGEESEEKDGQIAQMLEEIEELKFLNERKLLDYDEMKKEHFELQLKLEDFQIAGDQVDALRKICDKLEQEKKNTAFREQVLRMQLQNLANSSPDLRLRIDAILTNPHSPSYGSFSFY